MKMDYHHVCNFTPQQISKISVKELNDLLAEATEVLAVAKKSKARLDSAIQFKYSDKVDGLRESLEKESGVVRLEDSGFSVSADRPKNISWDQKSLADIAEKIRAGGEDPSEFIEISYKVSERKYSAWPSNLKKSFTPARTLKYGKEKIVIDEKKECSE